MDHFSSYAAAGNACLAEEERIERQGALSDELDRLAGEQARQTVNDDRVTPEMIEAVSHAMDGGDEERDVLVAALAHFDALYEMAMDTLGLPYEEMASSSHRRDCALSIMRALDKLRAKVIAAETRRIRPSMEIVS